MITKLAQQDKKIIARIASRYLTIHDPGFNLREIVKHILLLEDHLTHENKVCFDCISKHLMTIEAMAEEATCLDTNRIYGDDFFERIAQVARQWIAEIHKGVDIRELATRVRLIRKEIGPLSANPLTDFEHPLMPVIKSSKHVL